MSNPIIGIAGNELAAGSTEFYGNAVSYTPLGFVTAIEAVGGVPVILPMTNPELAKTYIASIDKLVLAGGHDVDPQFYGEDPHPKLQGTNPKRDLFEISLIKEALAQKKPIFGICRGMQLLNVTLGGTLYQDLSLYTDWAVRHLQDPTLPIFPTHKISIEPASHLEKILGSDYFVNSYHHQAVKRVASSLKITALSSDQLVEGLEWIDDSQKVLAIQWHPEMAYEHHLSEKALFDYFVNQL
ncbi:gamma-glutamyl-gamma-aminobutyrate hydrolase family protein [Vagococcus salmoninarum]|uniref:gamma-glutamyl-gamma-aminobutyrate hydrolase family protein n=1 Tax=Vagococcus salmoninarum TaxID=2739 RepID=UPI0018816E04|nr:gamma-glutamyl-gamma-aminobutyrate hydrolase family protein [Vagococcus salmoninarum]MBE9388306.1 gamma-glutamyl-gamma-aminobutyrate hydrolase family protein [Vagococcus salmoninarum]